MNKEEINSKLRELDDGVALIDEQAEEMAMIKETLFQFMKENNLKRLEVEGMIITLDEEDE